MKNRYVFFLIIIGLFFIGCQTSNSELSETIKSKITKEIKDIHKNIIQAFNNHDAGKILNFIDQSDSLHYVEHTQVTVGWNTLKNGFEKWHKANQDLTIELNQSYVNVLSKDIAVLVAAGTISKKNLKIQKFTWTSVFQKKENGWKIVNAHEAFSDFDN
jgi:ketosteroid isomerase-like protein